MSFLQIDPNSDFSYQNLPFGIFSTSDNVNILIFQALKLNYLTFRIRFISKNKFFNKQSQNSLEYNNWLLFDVKVYPAINHYFGYQASIFLNITVKY